MSSATLGIIADDLTGACDAAAGTGQAGLRTTVVVGVPDPVRHDAVDADCIIVALKSRSAPAAAAASDSARSARWLRSRGVQHLYQKYCSTFDSTDDGNIGPIADALADAAADAERATGSRSLTMTIGTPATPAVGRTQYQGHLFVHGRLLSESPMRHHPITPMRDADLVRVLGRQTERPVALVRHEIVRAGVASVLAELERIAVEVGREDAAPHVLVDATSDADLDAIASAALAFSGARAVVLGGAAGLAAALARQIATSTPLTVDRPRPAVAHGPALIISGSASERTREQVSAFPGRVVVVDPVALASGDDSLAQLERQLEDALGDRPVVVASSSAVDDVARAQRELGAARAAALVEATLAHLAELAVSRFGVRRMIVAGGETSGAVVEALGADILIPGAVVAPGVPWMTAERTGPGESIALLLKSGNFGQPDLFSRAWDSAP